MPHMCCVPGCRGNYANGPKECVFGFPSDDSLRKKWLKDIPRDNLQPNKNTKVCEQHFAEGNIWQIPKQRSRTGSHPAKGLWGIKHTRKPVDFLVSQAKNLSPGRILPTVNVEVSRGGFSFTELIGNKAQGDTRNFTVEVISYGVQDLVYTRVFSMIIVADESLKSAESFLCHSFVCDSRDQARRITYALAAVFQDYGRKVKEETEKTGKPLKRLAIDLRTPEEQAEDSDGETDA